MKTWMRIFLFLLAHQAAADETRDAWKKVGDWIIRVDAGNGNGCFMEKTYEDGVRIRFGFVPDRDGGFFSAMSRDWTHIVDGRTGTVKFFTSNEKFAGDVEMLSKDDWYGGWVFFNNPKFPVEIALRRSIRIQGPDGGELEIDLAGTSKAIEAMKDCQQAQK